ncbi:hypothetical protein FGD67_19075 [Colwellia sp. M166]|uniref:hypothetical protein n=1 Tax=Colwellia sp. M166 TaxID=2583805 RepID=UPI00211EB274|nr:hypothetical protein [Colwellia sp. M166]UUO25078.1 hypothetical protein FGD67_19075 [Colwellia sp. M166]|tara:strand:+ start:3987 stop:4418 length:432 start_codon:yes stop_codon:yes gene_type:complete
MAKTNLDGRIKLTRQLETKIVAILRRWNSKVTWDLVIERIKHELDFDVTKPTLRKFDKITREFENAKGRYKGVHTLPRTVVKNITEAGIDYYNKYSALLVEKEVMQEMLDEQYALIEKMFKNAEEIPNLSIDRLLRERPEDMT